MSARCVDIVRFRSTRRKFNEEETTRSIWDVKSKLKKQGGDSFDAIEAEHNEQVIADVEAKPQEEQMYWIRGRGQEKQDCLRRRFFIDL